MDVIQSHFPVISLKVLFFIIISHKKIQSFTQLDIRLNKYKVEVFITQKQIICLQIVKKYLIN